MSDTATGFEAWAEALADAVVLAREIGCQPAVVQALQAMVGAARPEDWHDNGPYWLYTGPDAAWNQAAKEAASTVPADELARFIHLAFSTHLRLEQMRASRMDLVLLKRAWPPGSKKASFQRAAWGYIGWASGIVVKAALKRKPALADDAALTQLRTLQRALLQWASDFVAEPDLPLKEVLAWIAGHRFAVHTQALSLVERIARTIELVPAVDAEDRKYTGHLLKSLDALREQFATPVPQRADAIAPRAEPYSAAKFHKDWDALAKAEMKRLGFERLKGSMSRWIKPVGERWLHVGFRPSKWGWTRHGGSNFCVAVELSTASDPEAVDWREGVHLFSAYTDAEFAAFLALNERARDTIRRLSFADEFTRRSHESMLTSPSRSANKRVPGDMTPAFEFYDPAELADWARALLPTLGAKLEQASAARG